MKWIHAIAVSAIIGVSGYLGVVGIPIAVLVGFMILDYISGVARALITGALSSKVGARGIVKKLCYMLVVAVGAGADYLIHGGLSGLGASIAPLDGAPFFCLAVTAWLIVNELISILENSGAMGLPIPEWLKKALRQLRDKADGDGEGK